MERPDIQKADIDRVLAEFDGKKDTLSFFGERTKTLIEELLRDKGIRYQSVQARVKTKDKLKIKYLDPKKDYRQLDDITDQIALRVITYYEDEVDRVAELIEREFDIDRENSVDKRETEPDKFGYYALNYVCRYSKGRLSHVEYKKFTNISCEIQIISILRHAWSEIEHPWYDLKEAFPADIKRRFARMAALLEIAESEFLSLRKIQADYQRSVAVQVEAKVPDIAVDAVSLRSFIEQEPLVAEIDKVIAVEAGCTVSTELPDSLLESRSTAAKLAGMIVLQDVRKSLMTYKTVIPEFVRRCRAGVWPAVPGRTQMSRALSIYHVSMLLVSAQGSEALINFFKAIGLNAKHDIDKQVAIAKEIMAKHLN